MLYQLLQTLSLNTWDKCKYKNGIFLLDFIFAISESVCLNIFSHISIRIRCVFSGLWKSWQLGMAIYWSRHTSVTWNQCPFVTTFHLTFPLPIVTLFDYIAKHSSRSPSMFLARLPNPDFFVLKESLKSNSLPVDYVTHCEVFQNVLTNA